MQNKIFFTPLLLVFFSCCTINRDMPQWDGKLWQADHLTMSVKRTQDIPPSEIKAEDPKFSKGVWISYEDLSCLYQQLINNCSAWKDPKPVCEPIEIEAVELGLKAYEESRSK